MPNLPNRNNRRKGKEHSETLIIPHITKEMLEKARSMAEQGASRAEIEQALAQMQGAPLPDLTASTQPAAPDPHRIIPKSRPRHTQEERQAMLEQLRKEREGREAARRQAEATPAGPDAAPAKPAAPVRPSRPAARSLRPAEAKTRPAPAPAQTPAAPAAAVSPTEAEQPTRTMPTPVPAKAAPQAPARPATHSEEAPRSATALPRTRAEAEARLNEKIRSDHIWLSNPVMVRGLGLAPVIGAALDGERALMLCVACLLLVTCTRVLAVAVCHLTGNRFRPVIYCYSAALLYIPVYILLNYLFGNDLTVLGIYLPILVAEPAIVKRMEFTELEPLGDALRHGFNNSLGMCAALLIVGCLREFLATGAVFGHAVLQVELLPLAALPAGGFFLVGVIAAVWCAVANAYTDYKHEEVRRLYANRKR